MRRFKPNDIIYCFASSICNSPCILQILERVEGEEAGYVTKILSKGHGCYKIVDSLCSYNKGKNYKRWESGCVVNRVSQSSAEFFKLFLT